MTSYDQIDDEDKLHEMMNKVDNFDERRKIRGRLRELRDKKMNQKTVETKGNKDIEKTAEATETKTVSADGTTTTVVTTTKQVISGKADNAAVAGAKTTTAEVKTQILGDGKKTTVIKKTETVSRTVGNSGGPAGKPAGGAMAAFKQLDASNPPKNLAPAKPLSRSPSAIKQMLLEWTKAMTQEYADKIVITNFSSSWNNGIAFCALIHHFYPEAFDFDALDPKKRRHNFDLAFDTAEKYADIAPLLDTDDMVRMQKPDWKCVFTYVQSFYRKLQKHENNKVMPKDM